ncbi:hypothetical protein BASA81_017611 [Batrachochytrium salamandrivorans]|nr:hypothetical protein BASA81_017611 [Batrachochytrium salamandrivorans]
MLLRTPTRRYLTTSLRSSLLCFSKKQSEKLPIHREFDCTIDLVPNAAPHHGKIYQLTQEEDKVMQDWIAENLAKGFIRNSSSPHGAPCFFVKQKDKLRLCMDYRGLNKNTIKDRNPIPLISEMLRTLSIGKVFTTLDLRGAYNLLRIKEGDEPKTAFITKYGQFEFLVMPFGLANAPAQFQRMMNTLFRDSIGKFVLVYLDDIVVYSEDLETHKEHLLKKDTPFSWGADQEKSISDLKKGISQTLVFWRILAIPNRSFWKRTASDFAISGVLSQFDDLDQIRPVAFYARQMNSAERNYEIYDKELLAIVDSFKHWRHFLQGGLHPVTVLCDHKSLEYFMSTKKLTRRQARWSLELSESLILQSLISDMDLHVIVHSEVLQKVFVLESDWPLIIADFLAGEDNVWMDDIPEVTLEKCKKELKNFRFRDDTFLRILEDGKSTATYVHYEQRSKDIKDFISRCPQCQLNQSASGIHSPLPIRPVPPVALPFERWGIDFYGPMAETKSGNRYLITCIDYATRWVLAKPVKEMTESAVAAFPLLT